METEKWLKAVDSPLLRYTTKTFKKSENQKTLKKSENQKNEKCSEHLFRIMTILKTC